eukprot:4382890-Prymnesium_polylepis.1
MMNEAGRRLTTGLGNPTATSKIASRHIRRMTTGRCAGRRGTGWLGTCAGIAATAQGGRGSRCLICGNKRREARLSLRRDVRLAIATEAIGEEVLLEQVPADLSIHLGREHLHKIVLQAVGLGVIRRQEGRYSFREAASAAKAGLSRPRARVACSLLDLPALGRLGGSASLG